MTNTIMPTFRQLLPNFGSSRFTAKYAMMPPIIPKNTGRIYHALDLVLGSLMLID